MSLPKREAGVDASAPKTKGKTGKTADENPKPLLKRQISPRDPHPYSLKAEHEQEEHEVAVAAGRVNEERRQAKRAAYWAATMADDEADPDEDDVDDAYAEEIRSLSEEDDPDAPSDQAGEGRPATSDLGVWGSGTDEQRARVREFGRHFDREQVEEYSSHDLLLLGVLWDGWIKNTKAAIDNNKYDKPEEIGATLKKLMSEKKWLEWWLQKHRPFAVANGVRRQLCEDSFNGREHLRGMDKWLAKKSAGGHKPNDVDEGGEQPAGPKGAQVAKKHLAGGHGKLDVSAQFYSREAKGRTVVVFEWVRKLIKKRMRDRKLSPQAYKSVGNLHSLMSQLLYWVEPQDDQDTPRAGESNRLLRDGFWWFVFSPHRLSKQTELSRTAVHSATRRLEDYGLVVRYQDKMSKKVYIRVRFESFANEVEDVVKSYRKKGTKTL